MYMIPIVLVAASILVWIIAAKLKRSVRMPFDFQSLEHGVTQTGHWSGENPVAARRSSMVRQDSSLSSAMSSATASCMEKNVSCVVGRVESMNRALFQSV